MNNIREVEVVIVGGGPAGLCAAEASASMGAHTIVIEKNKYLGGQLVKQTHMFFGSEKQYASHRGVDIATTLCDKLKKYDDLVEIMTDSTVIGYYEDGVLTVEHQRKYIKLKPKAIIIATGASEKFLSFPNNDLPGIYGAGAVQTLMNVHGVVPGDNVLMVGAGNIGLIVSYQLRQAGVNIRAIIDASPKIGGYAVHASKIRRMGIPIYTSHTIKYAHGSECLKSVTICAVDDKFAQIPDTDIQIDVDVCCISVGLTPLSEILWQMGCDMKFVPSLGGHVPQRGRNLQTSIKNIYVAGDVSGIEEASSAMVEGRLAGFMAANAIGYNTDDFSEQVEDCYAQLDNLRSGPHGAKTRMGIKQIERLEVE